MSKVEATRMGLMTMKKYIETASRGHKLLKDKQDGLMQEFLKIIRQAKTLRIDIQRELRIANKTFLQANKTLSLSFLQNILSIPMQKLTMKVKTRKVMSVGIPSFQAKITGNALGYGSYQSNGELDIAILAFSKVFKMMIKLTEIEKSAENLALEIEKTRQRVNALEHNLIPQSKAHLKFIRMKLDEMERSGIVQVMAIKNMIEAREKREEAKRKEIA
jgi:V/A-type H+-transporting ATPase subunit D